MQTFKTVAQTFLGVTAHFGLFPPKIGVFRGVGGPPEIFIGILLFLLLRSPCKNLKFYDNPFWCKSRGRSHNNNHKRKKYLKFPLAPMEVSLPVSGGVPQKNFPLDSSYFCYLGAHAKFQNCSTNPSRRNSPFWPFSAQNRLFWGVGRSPEF